jgi:hypothetical protein
MRKLIGMSYALMLIAASGTTVAQAQGKCEPANSQACINMRQAEETYKRLQRERQQQQTRDTRHDGRIPIDKNTSVGGTINPPSVNVRKTF